MAGRVIGTATVEVKADTSAFRSGLHGLSGAFGGIQSSIGRIGGAIAAIGFGHLAGEAINFGKETTFALERAEAMFRGLTSSEAEAQDMLKRMTEYAINTPFELPGLVNMAGQLLAVGKGFGVNTDNLTAYLDIIGNVAAATGGGEQEMARIVRVLGQMSSSGKVLGQDMNQLAQSIPGYDVWGALAEGTGKSVEELRHLQDLGTLDELLTGNEAVNILLNGMREFPGASGAMERRMETLEGSISKFKEQLGLALSVGLQPFFKVLQDTLGNPAIQAAIGGLIAVFAEFMSILVAELAPQLPGLIEAFALILTALLPLAPTIANLIEVFAIVLVQAVPLIEFFADMALVVSEWLTTLDPGTLGAIAAALGILWTVGFGPVGLVAAAVAGLAVVVVQNWDLIVAKTQELMDFLTGVWNSDWLAPARDAVEGFVSGIVENWDEIVAKAQAIVTEIVDLFTDMWSNIPFKEQARDAFSWLVDELPGFFDDAFGRIQELVGPIIDTFDDFAKQIEPVWEAIKRLASVAIAVMTPVIGMFVGLGMLLFNFAKRYIGPMVALVGELLGELLTIVANVIGFIANIIMFRWGDAWNNVTAILGAAIGLVGTVLEMFWLQITSIFGAIFDTVTQIWGFLWDHVRGTVEAVLGWIAGVILAIVNAVVYPFQVMWATIQAVMDAIVLAIDAGWQIVQAIVDTIVRAIQTTVETVWNAILTTIDTIVHAIQTVVETVWNAILTTVDTIINGIRTVVETVWNAIRTVVDREVRGIQTIVETVWNAINTTVDTIVNAIRTTVEGVWNGIRTTTESVWNGISTFVSTVWDEISGFVQGGIDDIVGFVTGLPGRISSAVSGAFDSIWQGFEGAINVIIDGINGIKLPGVELGGYEVGPFKVPTFNTPAVDPFPYIPRLARGGIITAPGFYGAEEYPEAVVPLAPWRQREREAVMRQAGLWSDGQNPNTGFIVQGDLVVQDTTDADLVAQRTLVAMQAAMVS